MATIAKAPCSGAAVTSTSTQTSNVSHSLQEAIRAFVQKPISDAMLTKIEGFIADKIGANLPERDVVKLDARLTKKQPEMSCSVTAVSSDGETIDGVVVHGDMIGMGAYSVVKTGLLITEETVKQVAIHKGLKVGPYLDQFNRNANEGTTGVYYPEIVRHKQLFNKASHPNIENVPEFCGWLDAWREITVNELQKGDIESHPCQTSQELLDVSMDIAKGLMFYHGNGVLHRDIKPTNILISHSGTALLSDPKEIDEFKAAAVHGTPSFLPLELTFRGAKQSRASDMYAFGVTLLDIKYKYLEQAINSISDPEVNKQALLDKMASHVKHTDFIADRALNRAMGIIDQVSLMHNLNKSRIKPGQEEIIDEINSYNGFGSEDYMRVKERLKKFDEMIEPLLDTRPQVRPSIEEILETLESIL